MRVLFDRNTPGKYANAIAQRPWSTVEQTDNILPKTAPDSDIADHAEQNDWVVFTRDEQFFRELKQNRACGTLYFKMGRNETPGTIADAVASINSTYQNQSNVACGLPGPWA